MQTVTTATATIATPAGTLVREPGTGRTINVSGRDYERGLLRTCFGQMHRPSDLTLV